MTHSLAGIGDTATKMMAHCKYTVERAKEALNAGWAYLIGFSRPFIATPDLPYRPAHNLTLNIQIAEIF